jgi:hypothetical protein
VGGGAEAASDDLIAYGKAGRGGRTGGVQNVQCPGSLKQNEVLHQLAVGEHRLRPNPGMSLAQIVGRELRHQPAGVPGE